MKKTVVAVIVSLGIFLVYMHFTRNSSRNPLRDEVEYQVKEGFNEIGNESASSDKQSRSLAPPNTPTIYSKNICNDARNRCADIFKLKRNAPSNMKFDSSFNDGVRWCEYVLQECKSRNL
jgi:hypothetical protein